MELFRSEEMQLMQLMIPAEAAHDTIAALGEVGLLQFKDLNTDKSAFQRTFANQIKRCDEMTRQLRYFTDEVTKAGISLPKRPSIDFRPPALDELEAKLSSIETELQQVTANADRLRRSHAELYELELVLERAGGFFEDARASADISTYDRPVYRPDSGDPSLDIGAPLLEAALPPEPKSVQLGFVTGTVLSEKLPAFERILFRATRGNMFLRSGAVGTVPDPATGEKQEKSVFVVFFAGERAKQKILKICEAFGANRYPFPDDPHRQLQMASEVSTRLRELGTTLDAGERLRENLLASLSGPLPGWTVLVRHEKSIYHTLNKLSVDVTRKIFVAEAWVPVSGKSRIQEALRAAAARAASPSGTVFQPLMTYEPPPTHFRTSKVTSAFQEIVDAYGIARYREANPAVFTIITFPFLFAIMFGDIGHGILLLLFAGYLVLSEKKFVGKDLGEILGMMFGGRYVILLMAFFSIYTGLLYNEFFSMVTTIFGRSKFACGTDSSLTDPELIMMDPASCPSAFSTGLEMKQYGKGYAFGVDPAWHGTRTELPFLNSLKMKMSILFGVAQMNLGIVLSYFNQSYFADGLSTWCEFIPQMIFLNCLFGYLSFLILLKWALGSQADLYHTLIYMFLSPGNVDCGGECPENQLFPGQAFVQVLLLLIALVAVPWMLIPKPYILKKRHEERMQSPRARYGLVSPEEDDFRTARFDNDPDQGGGVLNGRTAVTAPQTDGHHHGGGGGEFEFGEIVIHQMIHTIEFVLGAVSNTASYLRLWALSLAHSQLSAVFYDRVLMTSIQTGSPIAIFVGFYFFAAGTMGVLMVMESLSAFLHALRLHWVEFQNKFYHGDGYKFTPFSFEGEFEDQSGGG